jgi:hypothetical protein
VAGARESELFVELDCAAISNQYLLVETIVLSGRVRSPDRPANRATI